MTTISDIERRLRLPAPDEPSVLPALVLPLDRQLVAASGRTIGLRSDGRGAVLSPRLAVAVLLLLGALAGAIATGTLRLEQLVSPLLADGRYEERGIALDFPKAWSRLTPPDPIGNSPSNVGLLAASRDVTGCEPDSEAVAEGSPPPQPDPTEGGEVILPDQTGTIYSLEDRIYACLIRQPMEPGETRLVVARGVPQITGVGPFGDFAEPFDDAGVSGPGMPLAGAEAGFTERIGEMPAKLVVRSSSVIPGAEEVRTWIVAYPEGADHWYIQAVLRGPDLPALREQADAIARSLVFDTLPPELDEQRRDEVVAAAMNRSDAEMRRWSRVRFMGCLPRTPGSAEAVIVDGPAGALSAPLAVTCTTTVEATEVRLWRVTLEVAWPAASGQEAGRWARELLLDGNGQVLGEGDLFPGTGEPLPFPGNEVALPPAGPAPVLEAGELARILAPGSGAGLTNLDDSQLPAGPTLWQAAGTYLVILSGPERVGGRDWYLADTGEDVGWVPAETNGRPLLAAAEPRCPAPRDAATELAYLPAVLRRLCAGDGELTLGPVRAADAPEGAYPGGDGTPSWLISRPTVELFGEGDVNGLAAPLPVSIHPSLTADLPMGVWLRVTGHFDDAAAASCSGGLDLEGPAAAHADGVQARRCAERFVVTGFEPVAAP